MSPAIAALVLMSLLFVCGLVVGTVVTSIPIAFILGVAAPTIAAGIVITRLYDARNFWHPIRIRCGQEVTVMHSQHTPFYIDRYQYLISSSILFCLRPFTE
jgi:hypothetical protein